MSLPWIYATAFAVSAAVVFGALRILGRPKGSAGVDDQGLRIVTRTRVGVGRSLVLVEVQGRRLLLGSTREQWCALADLGRARSSEADDAFAEIEAELTRASESARHRRLRS